MSLDPICTNPDNDISGNIESALNITKLVVFSNLPRMFFQAKICAQNTLEQGVDPVS